MCQGEGRSLELCREAGEVSGKGSGVAGEKRTGLGAAQLCSQPYRGPRQEMNPSLSSLPLPHPQWDLGNPCPESQLVRAVTLSFLMGSSSTAALSTFLAASAKQSARLKMHQVSA